MTAPMSPERLAEIAERYRRTGAPANYGVVECACQDAPHENALHDLATDVPDLLAEIKRQREVIDAVRELVQQAEAESAPADLRAIVGEA